MQEPRPRRDAVRPGYRASGSLAFGAGLDCGHDVRPTWRA